MLKAREPKRLARTYQNASGVRLSALGFVDFKQMSIGTTIIPIITQCILTRITFWAPKAPGS
jgi:hypothetical protein